MKGSSSSRITAIDVLTPVIAAFIIAVAITGTILLLDEPSISSRDLWNVGTIDLLAVASLFQTAKVAIKIWRIKRG